MSDVRQLVRCTCGQMNRLQPTSKKAGEFKCGKCGRVILDIPASTSGRRAISNGLRVSIILVLLVGSVAVFKASNVKQARELQQPLQKTPNAGRQETKAPERKPIETVQIVPPLDHILPDTARNGSVQAGNNPTFPFGTRMEPRTTAKIDVADSGKLQMEYPAAGCPEKLPTYESLSAICRKLGETMCSQESKCSWSSRRGKCYPQSGTYVSVELTDQDLARFPDIHIAGSSETFAALEKARGFGARKQFNQAIAEYTRILRFQADYPEALIGRAATYQSIGMKDRAVADYCRLIVTADTRDRRNFARSQVALLTQAPASNTTVAAPDKSLPTPKTGELQPRKRGNAIAPFNVVTGAGSNYLLKLVNARNANDQIWIFVKGGEPYSTKMPVGAYRLRVASGDTWYGRQELFGPQTRLFRLRNKNGTALDEAQLLQFRKEGNKAFGMTLNFQGSRDGNLEQETMSRSEFDEN